MSLFGGAATTSAPASGLFGAKPATSTPSLFGAPAQTSTPSLFGAPAASTAATKPLFGATATSTPSLFGTAPATSTPSLFGAASTAPATGLFGAKPTTTTSGGLFGSTAPAAGGLFGSTAPSGGLFGSTQQQQLAPSQQRGTIEDLLQNSTALVTSVGDPQIFPDERNGIIALFNQLQAILGTGKGYYSANAPPVEYTMNGPYFRLKGICYNRMSDYDDADGMVSLILKVPGTKVATSQVRQQIVDELYVILGSKPNLVPRIDSVISLPDDKTEVTFYVEERGKGRIECNLLASYFKQDAQFKALQTKLEVEQLIPRAGVSKQYLRHYLENAPEGFDPNVWAQAVAENPDPEKLIPFPIRGVEELLDRQKRQKLEMNLQNNIAADMEEHIKTARRELSQIHSRMLTQRQKQKQISYRLLRVLAMQTLIQRYGARLDENELKLKNHLERLSAQLNGPGNLKDRLANVMDVLKTEMPRLTERQAQLNDPKNVFRGLDMSKFRDYLAEIQTALEQVHEVCEEHRNDLEVMQKKKNW
uniref:Nup54 domain-containing protein n=1 Tax=Steinernema glaseri TaxID=37863 RepID=A0A1I7ZWR0_9BILA